MSETTSATVTIRLEDARMIDRGFLPWNPNKCRKVDPEVLDAVRRFKAAIHVAHNYPVPK